ncbi:ABC transporter permease [Clostridiaceae bacterium 35-E11]
MLKKLNEILEYKELLKNLTFKELKLKYKNSTLGFFWSFLNPVVMMVVYTFAFKYVLKIAVPNFTVFLLCGLLPWIFFQGAVQSSTGSIVANGGLIKKVYFPREIVPLSMVLANFINFLITVLVLILSLFIFKVNITSEALLLPLILFFLLFITIGLSFILSALNVIYRDVSHLIEVIFMAWMYMTPVVYPLDLVPKTFQKILLFNPMTLVVQSIRQILLENSIPNIEYVLGLMAYSIILIGVGHVVFMRIEKNFAEEI